MPDLLIASNRGPVTFRRDEDGRLQPKRGEGGLATALAAALEAGGGLWVAAALSSEDREVAATGPIDLSAAGGRYRLRFLAVDAEEYDGYYNGISNRILWFVHHLLWDLPRSPSFGEETETGWAAYVRVNESFAAELAGLLNGHGGERATVLVQDYHLCLVPAMLRARGGSARIGWFSHIPFAPPGYLRILPDPLRHRLLDGILGADLVGFHARAWARNFLQCCRELPGAQVDLHAGVVRRDGREVRIGVYPISVDPGQLEAEARSEEARAAGRQLRELRGDRKLVVRADRLELSKNVLRGFHAFEEMLGRRPHWRERVTFLARLYASRAGIGEYRTYARECRRTVERINRELGTPRWQPIVLRVEDDFPATLAAYEQYDVLLVNPVFDGMNLVAKEGPVVNRSHGVLVLSENAGAADELRAHALMVNPFDVGSTSEALATALEMSSHERARRARGLADTVRASTPGGWVRAQLGDLEDMAPPPGSVPG